MQKLTKDKLFCQSSEFSANLVTLNFQFKNFKIRILFINYLFITSSFGLEKTFS